MAVITKWCLHTHILKAFCTVILLNSKPPSEVLILGTISTTEDDLVNYQESNYPAELDIFTYSPTILGDLFVLNARIVAPNFILKNAT